jgi:CBS domain-containing protein/sporulation protein YlmC with PRC-barrel domain
MYRLTDLLAKPVVTARGETLGSLADIVVRVAGAAPATVCGLLLRGTQSPFLRVTQAKAITLHQRGITLADSVPAGRYDRAPQEVRLEHDLLDGTVIDLRGPRLVRVNDVLLYADEDGWHCGGVDLGHRALLHRFLPGPLRHDTEPQLLAWGDLELLASEFPQGALRPDHTRLGRLHPADIARVTDILPTRQASEVLASLDDAVAADTMEEMVDEKQADVIELLDPDHAADILEQMAPDAAADVLAELEPVDVDRVLVHMEPAAAADVHALLTYAKDTAGGLMTTDYVIVPPELLVRDAPALLRSRLRASKWVYYLYVVTTAQDRRLLGNVSLLDLYLATPEQSVREIMTPIERHIGPEMPAAQVAQIMSDYNVLTLPVTDVEGKLLGVVTVDDTLEVVLPASLRRQLPRVFS